MTTKSYCRNFILLFLLPMLSSCSDFNYSVDILNFGTSGVIILQIGNRKAENLHETYREIGVPFPLIVARYPSFPSNNRNPAKSYGHFHGYDKTLPDQVELVWQLADLSDCKRTARKETESFLPLERSRVRGFQRDFFTSAGSCQWHPLDEKIFRKTVDLRPIKTTDAYKKTGQRYSAVAGSRYTLGLTLVFIEDQVYVEAANGATNPWL